MWLILMYTFRSTIINLGGSYQIVLIYKKNTNINSGIQQDINEIEFCKQ